MTKKIAVLGSTGSIGTQTLDVVSQHPDAFAVEALAAGANTDLLLQQIRKFQPKKVSVADKESAERIRPWLPPGTKLYFGMAGLIETAAATDADIVVSAVVGSRGLKPTLAAIEAGKNIALANKETLVAAGHLVSEKIRRHRVSLYPVDSEHSAIFQCLNGEPRSRVKKIVLTASGGAFRDRRRDELEHVTVQEALKHPNWSMGAKVTIDSATMANKGLEVIEAHWLFHLPYDRIEVIIHPESIVHSMVEFADHSILAQMGCPDMRIPIQYALSYPDRLETSAPSLDLRDICSLNFREMDFSRFPCLKMAYWSGQSGGTATAVFNAANEEAVSRFLNGEIRFLDIEKIVETVLEKHEVVHDPDLEEILAADEWARQLAANV